MSTVTSRTVYVSFESAIRSAWCDCDHPVIQTAGKGHELWVCELCGRIHENRLTGMTAGMVYATFPSACSDSNQDREQS